MAVSIVTYTGDGSTTQYVITFEYISRDDVVVTIDDVAATFTFVNDTTVEFSSAPAADAKIVIKRGTPSAPLVDFTDGSTLFEADLDLAHQQSRYLAEEARDIAEDAKSTVDANIDDVLTVASISTDVTKVANIDSNVTTVANNDANVTTVAGIDSDVTTVAGISGNVTTVAANDANVTTTATNIANVNTVAGIDANVTTVAGISGNVTTVANNDANVTTVATNDANITTVAGINGSVSSVAAIDTEVATVAGNTANITTVAGISSNVTTVAGISADVTAVVADQADIGTVATNISNINAVAGNSTNINVVAGNATNINAVAADATDIGTVSTNIANVNTVAGISSNVTTVAGVSANVTTVAGISADVTAVAGDASDIGVVATNIGGIDTIGTVATNITNVNNVGANIININTVAGAETNINTVATNLGGTNTIGTVAGSIANVNLVGGSIADVNTVASNLTDVQSFANTYRIGSTDPTTSLDTGDLFYNTTSSTLKVYTGSAWEQGVTAGSGFLPLTGGTLTGDLSGTNLTLSGYLRGPSTFTIDPAAHGDNTGTLVVAGNLQVDGTTTTINSTTLTVDDLNVTLASGAANAAAADGAGLTVDGASATFTYASTGDKWTMNKALDVSGSVTVNGTTIIDSSSNTPVLRFDESSAAKFFIGESSAVGGGAGYDLYAGTGDGLSFFTNASERMRIDTSGNLLVGKTSANFTSIGHELGVYASHTRASQPPLLLNRTTSSGDILRFFDNGSQVGNVGSFASGLYIGDDDTGLFFNASGNVVQPYSITSTNTTDGTIGLGSSAKRFSDAHFSGTVNAANFNSTSDATLKTNIETLSGSLDAVMSMRGVSFDWIENGNPEIGVIAQEVEEVLPELVNTNDEGIKSVKYGNIVAVLIEAIKEQQEQIDELKAQLNS